MESVKRVMSAVKSPLRRNLKEMAQINGEIAVLENRLGLAHGFFATNPKRALARLAELQAMAAARSTPAAALPVIPPARLDVAAIPADPPEPIDAAAQLREIEAVEAARAEVAVPQPADVGAIPAAEIRLPSATPRPAIHRPSIERAGAMLVRDTIAEELENASEISSDGLIPLSVYLRLGLSARALKCQDGAKLARTDFDQLSPLAKLQFCQAGGQLHENRKPVKNSLYAGGQFQS